MRTAVFVSCDDRSPARRIIRPGRARHRRRAESHAWDRCCSLLDPGSLTASGSTVETMDATIGGHFLPLLAMAVAIAAWVRADATSLNLYASTNHASTIHGQVIRRHARILIRRLTGALGAIMRGQNTALHEFLRASERYAHRTKPSGQSAARSRDETGDHRFSSRHPSYTDRDPRIQVIRKLRAAFRESGECEVRDRARWRACCGRYKKMFANIDDSAVSLSPRWVRPPDDSRRCLSSRAQREWSAHVSKHGSTAR